MLYISLLLALLAVACLIFVPNTVILLIFVAIVHGFAIYSACHALLHKRDSRAALGWIAIILFMPPVGLPLYWLFGIARIDSQAVRLMEKAAQKVMGGLVDLHGKSLTEKPEGFIDKDEVPHAWHYLVNPGSSITGRCMLEGNDLTVLHNGEAAYPVMLKAASGGGGKGIRVAESVKDLKDAYDSASAEAIANFGDGRLYMEKYIHNPRHIEVQILGDNYGNVVHLFERECSVQRRHQKLIEESPSAFVTPELREKMTSAAVALAKRVGYRNAGTIEFLVDNDRNFYFCEMNTRIQVEHPVTEEVTGVDLVCEQLRVAAGEPLSFKQEDLTIRGHAIECRINAEDPSRNFAPCPGTLVSLHLPGGPGVRVDSAAYQGYKIPPFYDSMIGKLIVYGADREQAIVRMRRALAEMLFEGVVTATDYQMHILCSKAFVEANFNVNSIANGDFD